MGVSASSSLAVERSKDVVLDPAGGDGGLVYAGLSYRWRALVLSAEVEGGALPSYGPRRHPAYDAFSREVRPRPPAPGRARPAGGGG